MTKYTTISEVIKNYPFITEGNLNDKQKEYLLNNDIRSVDEDYNINCENCRDCEGCIDCLGCTGLKSETFIIDNC